MRRYRIYFIGLVSLLFALALSFDAQAKKKKKGAKKQEPAATAPVVNCPDVPDKVQCNLDVGTLPEQSCKCDCAGGGAAEKDDTPVIAAIAGVGAVALLAVIFLFIGYKSSLNRFGQELGQAVEAIGVQSAAISTENQYRDWLAGAVQHLVSTDNEPSPIEGTDFSFVSRAIREGILAWAPSPAHGKVVLVDRFRPPL